MNMNQMSFASDNYAPVPVEILNAIQNVNAGHMPAYGSDEVTFRAEKKLLEYCGGAQAAFFVFNGTGANVLALSLLTQPGATVICSQWAHIANDEGGAPESLLGIKLKLVNTQNGKLCPEILEAILDRQGDVHSSQVRAISLSQTTEYGTCYNRSELTAICQFAHKHKLLVHVDGARLLNSVAYLGEVDCAYLKKCGVDVLSFGGTKAGLLFGEAVVIFNEQIVGRAAFERKRLMQLSSKMRFVAAQFECLIDKNFGLNLASSANNLAKILASKLLAVKGVSLSQQVQGNAVFVNLPRCDYLSLQKQFPFYIWQAQSNEARLMCSWNINEDAIEQFVKQLVISIG